MCVPYNIYIHIYICVGYSLKSLFINRITMLVMNKHHQLLINAPFGNSTERQTARGGTCHHNMSLTKNGYMMIHGSQFRKMMTNKGIFGASCFQITSDNPRF